MSILLAFFLIRSRNVKNSPLAEKNQWWFGAESACKERLTWQFWQNVKNTIKCLKTLKNYFLSFMKKFHNKKFFFLQDNEAIESASRQNRGFCNIKLMFLNNHHRVQIWILMQTFRAIWWKRFTKTGSNFSFFKTFEPPFFVLDRVCLKNISYHWLGQCLIDVLKLQRKTHFYENVKESV